MANPFLQCCVDYDPGPWRQTLRLPPLGIEPGSPASQAGSWSRRSHTATKIPFMYSFSGNSAASAPISTFICLWATYIDPRAIFIYISSCRIGRPIVGIYKSLTDAWMWKLELRPRDIPILGIFVSTFRYFVFAMKHFSLPKEMTLRTYYCGESLLMAGKEN